MSLTVSLNNLPKLSLQRIFNHVVKNLLNQGKRSTGKDGRCKYRGPNGLKCAAGWVMQDKEYRSEWDEYGGARFGQQIVGYEDGKIDFIFRLQKIHDDYSVTSWKRRLRELAHEYGLRLNQAGL